MKKILGHQIYFTLRPKPVLIETSAKGAIYLQLQNITLKYKAQNVLKLFTYNLIPSLQSISRTPNIFHITIKTSLNWNKS